MGSSRLPGKSLVRLGGIPLIDHVVSRACLARRVDEVIVAIPSLHRDDILAEHILARGLVPVYRGPSDDVLGRMLGAAESRDGDIVVRLTADDPFKDPEIIDLLIEKLTDDSTFDFATNVDSQRFPEGLDVEVVRIEALQAIALRTLRPQDREHVTAAFYDRPKEFPSYSLSWPEDLISWRLTLDTPQDLVFLDAVAFELYRQGAAYDLQSLVTLIRGESDLLSMMPQSARVREQ